MWDVQVSAPPFFYEEAMFNFYKLSRVFVELFLVVYQAAIMHIIAVNKVAIYLLVFFMKRDSHAV